MSIVDALKKLVVALGGAKDVNEVHGANVAEVIDVLAENPPASGGDSTLRIKVTDGIEAGTYVSDTTFAEIVEAIEADRILICDVDATFSLGSSSMPGSFTFSDYSRNNDSVVFLGDGYTFVENTPIAFMVSVLLSDGAVSIQLIQLAVAGSA